MPTPLLTQQAAAARIGISVRSLLKLIAAPDGPPAVTLGSRKFLHPEDLDGWVEARREAAKRCRAVVVQPAQDEAA